MVVDAVAHDHHLTFRVADAGSGIDPEIQGRIFEPFVTTKADGSKRALGLGLAVVKAITEAQGGTVSLATGRDGTTVSLTLPLDTDQG